MKKKVKFYADDIGNIEFEIKLDITETGFYKGVINEGVDEFEIFGDTLMDVITSAIQRKYFETYRMEKNEEEN